MRLKGPGALHVAPEIALWGQSARGGNGSWIGRPASSRALLGISKARCSCWIRQIDGSSGLACCRLLNECWQTIPSDSRYHTRLAQTNMTLTRRSHDIRHCPTLVSCGSRLGWFLFPGRPIALLYSRLHFLVSVASISDYRLSGFVTKLARRISFSFFLFPPCLLFLCFLWATDELSSVVVN